MLQHEKSQKSQLLSYQNHYDIGTDIWTHEKAMARVAVQFSRWFKDGCSLVLDIGAGMGRDVRYYRARNYQTIGIDICGIRESNNICDFQNSVIKADVFEFSTTKRFDAICDNGCFHHYEKNIRKLYASKIAELLQSEGVLCLSVFSSTSSEGDELIMPDQRYRRSYSLGELEAELYEYGFELKKHAFLERERTNKLYLLTCFEMKP